MHDLLRFSHVPLSDWIRFTAFLIGLFALIGAAEWARAKGGWSAEINRKGVHIGTGLLICMSPYFFQTAMPLVAMAALFVMVNGWGIKSGHLRGMHPAGRQSYGTVLYPLAFGLLAALCWPQHKAVLIAAIGVLAFGDAAAALVGENLKKPHTYRLGTDPKSLEGSAVMALVSFLTVWALLPWASGFDQGVITSQQALIIALLTAPVATALEALSSRGSDNLTAPLGAAFVIWLGISHSDGDIQRLALGMVLAALVALASYRARFLTASGSTATFVLATVIFGIGGWTWSVPILVFFVLSSLLSKVGRRQKNRFDLIFEKSGCRDSAQVWANGGVAGLAMLAHAFGPHPVWYAAFLAALAAATADTWATEIGVFSKRAPRSVISLKSVAPGTSGGITLLGLTAAAAGSALIAATGFLLKPDWISFSTFGLIVLAGVTASLVDSLLGATIQTQYRCPVCHKVTERQNHCNGKKTLRISGLAWLNNDWVNGLASLSGAILAGIWTMI